MSDYQDGAIRAIVRAELAVAREHEDQSDDRVLRSEALSYAVDLSKAAMQANFNVDLLETAEACYRFLKGG